MAGRPRIVRSIQSYVNKSDSNSGIGILKAGTSPKIGVSRNFWYNYQTQCSQGKNDFNNSPEYYATLQWQRYGNLRPSFVASPRQGYTNYATGSYPTNAKPLQFNGNFNSN